MLSTFDNIKFTAAGRAPILVINNFPIMASAYKHNFTSIMPVGLNLSLKTY